MDEIRSELNNSEKKMSDIPVPMSGRLSYVHIADTSSTFNINYKT